MAPPPPSFSSFPDLTPKPKPPPPSFTSFPAPAPAPAPPPPPSHRAGDDDDSTRPAKRPRAAEFLDSLQDELAASGIVMEGQPVASGSRSRERREDEDDGGRRSSRKEDKGHRSSKDKHSSKHGDKHRSKEGHKSKGSRRDDDERDSDYGAKTDKPYKLVKALQNGAREPSLPKGDRLTATEPRLFYSDRQGDEYNIRYGSLHKGDIPRYRRLGAGRIVGLNSGLRITKETAYAGRALEVGANTTYRTPRYTDPRSAHHTTDRHAKRIRINARPPPLAFGESPDPSQQAPPSDPFLASSADPTRFVAFELERSLPEKLAELEFEEGTDYRSIAGLVKPSDLEDSDSDSHDAVFDGLGITGGESHDAYLKRRNIELDRSLRERPADVDLWLEFVEFQDEVSLSSFVGAGAAKRALSKVERTSTSDIKLSILDRALAVEENKESEKLLLAYLSAAAEVWDPKLVLAKWDETLRRHPTLTGLFIEYVSWRQTSWVNFEIRTVMDVFVDCFKVLATAGEKEPANSTGREMLEGNSIYLFLRCCLMLRQAGFGERALAAFQTIIELNYFRPDDLQRPRPREAEPEWLARVFTELENFWDSGSPRIGDAGAFGWKGTADDTQPPVAQPPPAVKPSLHLDENPFERWAETERLTGASQSFPARPDDPGVDDDIDPFRVVLFDDVRDFIFIVHSPDSHLQLAYAFLTFLGLPFVPPDFPTSTAFSTDTFIHSELAERPDLREQFWPKQELVKVPYDIISGEPMELERTSALKDPFETPFHATPAAVDFLFATKPKWLVTLTKADFKHVEIDFVRNVFTSLRPLVKDGFFTLNFFAFESAQSPKAAVKLAKQVLRVERQNLALWDGYARVERQRGKVDDARAVYVTALSIYRTFDAKDQIDGPLLWRAWAEMEWEDGRPMLALKVLVASADIGAEEVDLASLAKVDPDVRPSPSQILKARQYHTRQLEASFQSDVPQSTLRNRNHVAYSSAIFEYASQGLASAVEVLERHLFRLDCAGVVGSAEYEEAYILYVKLLYRHAAAGGGFRPGQLRDVLERAIKEFPNNSLFLSVFYNNELRMKIQNRVRRTLEECVLTDKVATSEGWLFAIFAELHLDARSPSVWGVRNLFDRAIENPRTRPSASLWTLYINFEIRNGELARAKSLVYRGIRECPWCKELYLKPFSPPLRGEFRSKELQQVHSLLLEKGLRVRVELDEFMEGWASSDVEVDGEEDEQAPLVVRETEELYDERRRLMPY